MKRCCFLFALLLPILAASAQTPALEVENSTGATLFQVNTDGSLIVNPQGATNGHVLTTDASGNATWQAPTGGFMLPFDGTWDQISPAFKITKTAGGETMDLRNTVGSRLIYGVMSNGVPGSVALQFQSSHNGILMQSGNGTAFSGLNNSASPTIQAVNNGSGVAGRFDGDVEVTGDVVCTACVQGGQVQDNSLTGTDIQNGTLTGADVQNGTLTAGDVDNTTGFYVSKTQLYSVTESMSVSSGGFNIGRASCNDDNDLPLIGWCSALGEGDLTLQGERPVDWMDTTAPAAHECTYRNDNPTGDATVYVHIMCIAVD